MQNDLHGFFQGHLTRSVKRKEKWWCKRGFTVRVTNASPKLDVRRRHISHYDSAVSHSSQGHG